MRIYRFKILRCAQNGRKFFCEAYILCIMYNELGRERRQCALNPSYSFGDSLRAVGVFADAPRMRIRKIFAKSSNAREISQKKEKAVRIFLKIICTARSF